MASVTSPSDLTDHVRLPDGRRLDVRVSGPADGLPLVFHHGTPGAATPIRALERAAHARGMRLVTTSRPGYGQSDRQQGRGVVDVVADTNALLDALGADRVVVAGASGGGPHALACAARLERCAAALSIAGVAPYEADGLDWPAGMGEDNVIEFGAALQGEDILRPYLDGERAQMMGASVDGVIEAMGSLLPEADRAVLTADYGEDVLASFDEGLRLGVDGWIDDDLAFVRPWGFGLDEITVPVMVWQGSTDLMVPYAHGEWLAAHLPQASVHLKDGEGHLSILLGAVEEMLDELLAAASG